MALDLEQYRQDTDRFLAELEEEFYLHVAGRKAELELAPIYERFSDLTTLATARELGDLAATDPSLIELWRSACEGYLEDVTTEPVEEVARLESTLEPDVDGVRIPYRMLYTEISNQPDRARRERLDQARSEVVGNHLNPPLVAAFERARSAVHELGAANGRELYTRFGLELEELAASVSALLADTETLYEDVFGALAERRVGISLDEIERHDVLRLWRAPEWDAAFPSERMVPALEATLADLGIDLSAQDNVELDVEDRPAKRSRPSCMTIEVPGRIVLVMKPIGGLEDWRGLFHEAGHAEHFAHTRASLPVEARRFGDDSVTEAYAFLMELLVDDPSWLRTRFDVSDADEIAHESAVMRLHLVRRWCGKFLYELELRGDGELEAMPERYRELVGGATKVDPLATDYLLEVDAGFYSTCYLRAWAAEAQLSSYLAGEYGEAWFARREAGDLLRELWREGQSISTEELVSQVTGKPLELTAIGERIRSRLA